MPVQFISIFIISRLMHALNHKWPCFFWYMWITIYFNWPVFRNIRALFQTNTKYNGNEEVWSREKLKFIHKVYHHLVFIQNRALSIYRWPIEFISIDNTLNTLVCLLVCRHNSSNFKSQVSLIFWLVCSIQHKNLYFRGSLPPTN